MSNDVLERYKNVTVVGAGVIGISWIALFLAHGLKVTVNDPRPDLEQVVLAEIQRITPTLKELGYTTENLTQQLRFEKDLARAVEGAALVQENGPERLELKQSLYAQMEQAVSPETLLLSSSSGLRATDIAQNMQHKGRMLIGHPFNPPHLIPLVEVVPGEQTDRHAVDEAVAFYAALGKKPRVLRKEIPGFVANRLQAALFRECVYLVREGVVTLDELDDIVTNSIGLRWATGGPFLSFHLGGGPGGLPAFIKHLGPGLEKRWESQSEEMVHLDDEFVRLVTDQVENSFGAVPYEALETERDQKEIAIVRSLAALAASKGTGEKSNE
uniref:Hydroxylacyl-CoA dehydrogenase n=1 Tax=Thermosporothrix sp. COM3 TaxID=2490863 RepID=A0A455SD87_9CHLR|nr:hydroxylacyl-CoA dehydrogenase [Thermosporothrix sp. COM3]